MAGRTPEEADRLIAEAISAQDMEATLDLYEPEALFVDPDSGTTLRGHEKIRAGLRAVFEVRPRLEGQQLQVFQTDDIALVLSKAPWFVAPFRNAMTRTTPTTR
jgi:ketosteroid isomerase-like protein